MGVQPTGRYSRDQLIGAPHNIIRHPSMPGGAIQDRAGHPDPAVAELLPQVADVVQRGHDDAAALAELAERCRTVEGLDAGPVLAQLNAIAHRAANLQR